MNILIRFLTLVLLMSACTNNKFYKGYIDIAGSDCDTTLIDSSMIYGTTFSADPGDPTPVSHACIWIENTDYKTISDSLGRFELKLPPGEFTVKSNYTCSDNEYTAILDEILFIKNEKFKLNIYIGIEIW